MSDAILGAVSARLAQAKVHRQFQPTPDPVAPDSASFSARVAAVASERRLSLLLCLAHGERTVSQLGELCRFDRAITAEDLELLGRYGLVRRSEGAAWRLCCPDLALGVARLVDLVLTPRPTKETDYEQHV